MAKQFKPETLCVQAGWTPKKGAPRVLPIYQSTTFKYDTSEQMARLFDLEDSGYFYTRLQNPTNDAVAAKIAALEGGVAAMLTSSGQAANFYAIFNICQAGDHFVCSSAIYGGTFNLFGVTMKKLGIDVTFVNPDASEEEISAAFQPNTKALFGETISNPSLEVLDIEKFARIAHNHGVPLIVDNTFPTPINCRPFEWGADIVVHSTTKYMDGHATSVGGCVIDSGNFDWDAHADKFPGLKACTLQEYIDICKKYNCHPIIEIKDPRKDKMQYFYNVLLKNDLLKDAVIISFILDDLKELHDIDPTLNMWYLVNYLDSKNIKDARDAGCSGMDFSAEFNACRPEWIRKVHDNGLKTACWTVDNREMLASMIDAGVEYITTNSILPE